MPNTDWRYEPAADLNKSLADQLRDFPREPHLWVYLLRSLCALAIRTWLRIYHRFEVRGIEHLPLGKSFIMVANHQSHLDALSLTASIPLRYLHRVFPAAAADYFFTTLPRSAFSSVVINSLPFDRKHGAAESLSLCRRLLETDGNVLIIFPEGTRNPSGKLGRFRSGVGRLAEGTDILVVPCFLEGAYEAFPKGAALPRPSKVVLHIGEPRSYGKLPVGKPTVQHICADLESAVAALGSS